MDNYLQRPVAYLLRVGTAEENHNFTDPPLSSKGVEEVEAAAYFLSYERLGKVVTSDLSSAVATAEIIWNTGICSRPAILPGFRPTESVPDESREQYRLRLSVIFGSLVQPKMRLPVVFVCYPSQISMICDLISPGIPAGDVVAPGGIIAIYHDGNKFEMDPRMGVIYSDAGSL